MTYPGSSADGSFEVSETRAGLLQSDRQSNRIRNMAKRLASQT